MANLIATTDSLGRGFQIRFLPGENIYCLKDNIVKFIVKKVISINGKTTYEAETGEIIPDSFAKTLSQAQESQRQKAIKDIAYYDSRLGYIGD